MEGEVRTFLSAPAVSADDVAAVVGALESGWIAPAGPALRDFEEGAASYLGRRYAVALSSGTAALHLGLKYLGVKSGDFVLVPDVTFAATAFAVTYLDAIPYFLDVDDAYGNLDLELIDDAARDIRSQGGRVAAAIPVDLYGTPVDYSTTVGLLADLDIPILEDAAESLGSRVGEAMTGSFGQASILSFNGNKILTTSGGGMLLTDDEDCANAVRKWATQSREAVVWYEHEEVGYNYRMTNIQAAIGVAQAERAASLVSRKKFLGSVYDEGIRNIEGVKPMPTSTFGDTSYWLVPVVVDSALADHREMLMELMASEGIQTRVTFPSLHRMPAFAKFPAAHKFPTANLIDQRGLCLPNTPRMNEDSVQFVLGVLEESVEKISTLVKQGSL